MHTDAVTRHLTIPNQLTILRILLVPVIGAVLAIDFNDHYQIGAVAYVTAAATDTLDGRIARSRNLVTELGKFLDPLADKLLVNPRLGIPRPPSFVPSVVGVGVAAREFLITGLRSVAAGQGVVVSSTQLGKSKAFTQNCMILLIILAQPYPLLELPAVVFIWIAVIATIISGLDYLWRYRRFII